MFAALVLEKEPMFWSELPGALRGWAQVVGIISALGILIWVTVYAIENRSEKKFRPKTRMGWSFLVCVALSVAAFAFVGLTFLGDAIDIRALAAMAPVGEGKTSTGQDKVPTAGDWAFSLGGLFALLAVSMPLLFDIGTRLRWGRIWALARLSIKEAIRSRVVLIFGFIALIFLFADWFVPYKPEDQLRNYVAVIYLSLPPLFLLTASLLGAFSIPADIRSQSIHTIVTKPVEKFEIVLGRFVGYALLMTVCLAVVGLLSLGYILRGIHDEAKKESFKARVPIYAKRVFEGTRSAEGEHVGRPGMLGDYRRYIGGRMPRDSSGRDQYAIWLFDTLPADLGSRAEAAHFEFSFDIYRMTKGAENKGVYCNFLFIDGRACTANNGAVDRDGMLARLTEFRQARNNYQALVNKELKNAEPPDVLQKVQEQIAAEHGASGALALDLAKKQRSASTPVDTNKRLREEVENVLQALYGVYDPAAKEVLDYHTQPIDVPAILLHRLLHDDAAQPRARDKDGKRQPLMCVWVSVSSDESLRATNAPQMVGMAEKDLYLLAAEKPFWQNFLKGLSGMWFTFMLVLGIAVPCSTYLSGVISWLVALFLFTAGMGRDFVQKLAEGQMGGPMDSLHRIFTHTFHSGALEETPLVSTFKEVDAVYQFLMRVVLNILPDVNRFDMQEYVANGFDIAVGRMLVLNCFLPLVGYLVPWMILGYFLIKYREIANPH